MTNFSDRLIQMIFIFVGKGLTAVCTLDKEAEERIKLLPEGYTLTLKTERGIAVSFRKTDDTIRTRRMREEEGADSVVVLKNNKAMLKLLFAQESPAASYAENRLYVFGDSTQLVNVMYALNKLLAYLYPRLMIKKIYLRMPRLSRSKLRIYLKLLLNI